MWDPTSFCCMGISSFLAPFVEETILFFIEWPQYSCQKSLNCRFMGLFLDSVFLLFMYFYYLFFYYFMYLYILTMLFFWSTYLYHAVLITVAFVICFQIWKCEFSSFVPLFQYCFGSLGSLAVPCEVENYFSIYAKRLIEF